MGVVLQNPYGLVWSKPMLSLFRLALKPYAILFLAFSIVAGQSLYRHVIASSPNSCALMSVGTLGNQSLMLTSSLNNSGLSLVVVWLRIRSSCHMASIAYSAFSQLGRNAAACSLSVRSVNPLKRLFNSFAAMTLGIKRQPKTRSPSGCQCLTCHLL